MLHWLRLIHPDLPRLVKQRYGTDLRTRTLASLKPEISQALDSLLAELSCTESPRVLRSVPPRSRPNFVRPPTSRSSRPPAKPQSRRSPTKSCPLCLQAGRASNHYLSECSYLPEQDKRYMAKARQVAHIFGYTDDDDLTDDEDCHTTSECPSEGTAPSSTSDPSSTRRIQIRQSPYFDVFYEHHTVRITIDSGATGNMIRASTAKAIGCNITESSQSAHQADGSSPLDVIGETRLTFTRNEKHFTFVGLVVENLDVEVLAGTPFMEHNDIAIRPAKREITLSDGTVYSYGSTPRTRMSHTVRRAYVLRAPPRTTTIFPGQFVEVPLPAELQADETVALEPRIVPNTSADSSRSRRLWPTPCIVSSVAGRIRIPNLSVEPRVLRRNEHFCQVHPVFSQDADCPPVDQQPPSPAVVHQTITCDHSAPIVVDPDEILPQDVKHQFEALHTEFEDVFDPRFKGYNGAVGPFKAVVNMGPVQPPQRKGRLPLYSRDKLVDLQTKFDELEALGVFARPEDVDITVEYLNPSFLVKKPSGGFRLVTAFADVGRYSKPQPSLMPDVDSTLRKIGQWRYIIASDLTNAFYQIPLSRESMKYCGVATPFRGVRVYTRTAMGMPGSETALEELMCRVLGDLLVEGVVVKLADDLYCGGDTPTALLHNWGRVLSALSHSGLHLSASKTKICPKTTNILGWIWSQGTLRASPHRIAALAACPPPSTVKAMRSFIGAFKMLARVIPRCSAFLSPLDSAIAGLQSQDTISWTDELHSAFDEAQRVLSSPRTITLPRPTDQLWLVTDGSVKKHSIGSTLYVTRHHKPLVAGFFSAKLRGRQISWLPCEIEALAIATSIKHFSPYIVQAQHRMCVLTDSKPCVQAFEKLCRGEFSASPRVSTFLSTVSRYQLSLRHLSGSANVPSDFASRNAPLCDDSSCQVCSFVRQIEDSVVHRVSTEDILSGKSRPPFTSRPAWVKIQSECSSLRRTCAHLVQGTRPSRKLTNIRDVKRYLQVATIARDGLLVVRQDRAFLAPREAVIVPRNVLDGLLTALHIQLNHPTAHQLKAVASRYFYALDLESTIKQVTDSCHHCVSLRTLPKVVHPQTTSDPPDVVGVSFAADVLKRSRQLILVLRETVTSFTAPRLIPDEKKETLQTTLLQLCMELRPLDGPTAVIRTDPAPGFSALCPDRLLESYNIRIEVGRPKNMDKNPVAEKAIRELEDELLRHDSLGGSITSLTLSVATARLNSRLRSRGLSAREMLIQRDQFTCEQIPFSDMDLITAQHDQRQKNHPYSAKSKAQSRVVPPEPIIHVGDLVYLRAERSKLHARPRYLVCSIDGAWCNIRKFVGNQLRSSSYRVRLTDCLKVTSTVPLPETRQRPTPDDHEDLDVEPDPGPSDASPGDQPPLATPPVRSPPVPPDVELPRDDLAPAAPSSPDLPAVPPELSNPAHVPPDTSPRTEPSTSSRYPRRERRLPTRLHDYVLD